MIFSVHTGAGPSTAFHFRGFVGSGPGQAWIPTGRRTPSRSSAPGPRRVLEDQPARGVPYVLLVVIGVTAALIALTALPRALGEHARVGE